MKKSLEFCNIISCKQLFFEMPYLIITRKVLGLSFSPVPVEIVYIMANTDMKANRITPFGFVTRIASSIAQFTSSFSYK